ncbi:hypothetical protein ASG17_00785 [Brevundimonas sp. Leaf363]|uniref:hypothetical protein n=1 Tax=Brevundimonas sp. Leaf363 TaxID=1736353 RepID=UPI0006F714B9|nr:hypothetical protein [Brevundimonas sp. Leaf363]KQS57303.1 hypothetical protein ASG17_00785 [Brevundimonas sp. Leaf363]
MTIVLFTMEKKRADSPDRVAFSYANEEGVSYDQKLASVQRVDPDDLDEFCVTEAEVAEHRVAITIDQLIDGDFAGGKMALAKATAAECGVSHRVALGVLERYTGTTIGQHYWTFAKGPRGVQRYVLIPKHIDEAEEE